MRANASCICPYSGTYVTYLNMLWRSKRNKSSTMISMQSSELLIQEIKYWQEITMIKKWLPGEIVEVTGPVSYKVRIDRDGRIFQKHQDQLRKGIINDQSSPALPTLDDCIFPLTVFNDTDSNESSSPKQVPNIQPIRKSTRVRKAPDRLTL